MKSNVPQPRFGRRLLILLGGFALLVLTLSFAFPPAQWSDGEEANFVRLLLIGAVVVVSVAASRQKLSIIAGQLAAWMGVLVVLVAGYGYRFELQELYYRTLGELMPTRGRALDHDTVTFARGTDLQFWVDATVEGRLVRFLVDTGASGVVLTRDDARRLGFRVDKLAFTQIFETANGTTRGAAVRLAEMRIGPITFDDVPASVNEGEMRQSLLGMRLLQRLSSVEISNDKLTIRR